MKISCFLATSINKSPSVAITVLFKGKKVTFGNLRPSLKEIPKDILGDYFSFRKLNYNAAL
ncbi:hypothetical protein SDC9_166752 [bioreactor metagenome]|uniref:Uncharacterized protein n=1 Tax=bioreactor metagenome TaxID=1076179 RepID=A0A645G634_9ZZZZ